MQKFLSLVKFTHTIFAMPFALIGVFWGFQVLNVQNLEPDKPWWQTLILVLICMVTARNSAMGFNRFIDRDIDALNERTQIREIPAGIISPRAALGFVLINVFLFVLTTWFINSLCFYLSPVALAVVLGYSLTKRFTALCHFILGLGLSLAPVGAFLAVTGRFEWEPIILGIGVLAWVSGFDIIYALQDEQFDKAHDLHSVPAWIGRTRALWLSSFLHLLTAAMIVLFGLRIEGGLYYWIGTTAFLGLLFYQHLLVKPNDLSKVNLAFFTTNGIASVLFAVFVLTDWWI